LVFAPAPVGSFALRAVCFAHCVFNLRQDRRAQKEIDQLGIELGFPPLTNRRNCVAEAAGVTVPAPVCNRVEAVGDRNHPRCNRYSLPL